MAVTVKYIQENINNFTEEERVKYIAPLIKNLSHLSNSTLRHFQKTWIPEGKTYQQFVEKQNKVILECVGLELSELGKAVRESDGLPELKPETIVID